jgi:hypothetical protein
MVWLAVGCGDDDGPAPMPDAGTPVDGGADAGTDAGPTELVPDMYCPGSPDCLDEGDMILRVGVARVEITPVIDETTEILTVDLNGNGEYDPPRRGEPGDEFRDLDGDGSFDGVWIAGYGLARGATGVSDPQYASAISLSYNQTTIVLGSVDAVGWFISEMDAVREMVDDLPIDQITLSATHSHQSRDTVGIWGPAVDISGADPAYVALVRTSMAMAIRTAHGAMEPAHVQYATLRLRDAPLGVIGYTSDARHPIIIDDEVRIMRFVEAADETATITTLVNWGSHPEYGGDTNQLLSSDYPHWLRDGVENGVTQPDGTMVPGVGGITVFFQGALGSQIGPYGGWERRTFEGEPMTDLDLRASEAVGKNVATLVLEALAPGAGSVMDETAALGVRTKRLYVDIENIGFHIAIVGQIFTPRPSYNWDETMPLIAGDNEPDLLSEVAVIDIGRAQILTAPGELDPALFVGGYDGSYTPMGMDIINTSEENPPVLSMAPEAPYLRDLMRADAEYRFLFGLANDFLGYFIPSFDYLLHPSAPYIEEAAGEHYEETNSVGPMGWPKIEMNIRELLAWTPDAG